MILYISIEVGSLCEQGRITDHSSTNNTYCIQSPTQRMGISKLVRLRFIMKKLLLLLFLLALFTTMCSCSLHDQFPAPGTDETQDMIDNNYDVYVLSVWQTPRCLVGYPKADTALHIVHPSEPSIKMMSISINGTDYVLNYVETIESGVARVSHEYKSADNAVICGYRTDSMELARITLLNYPVDAFANMDQKQYDHWIRTFVSQFSDEDWNDLQPSCVTFYKREGEDCREDYFKQDFAANETLSSYMFQYDRFVNAIATSDGIRVAFTFDKSSESTVNIAVSFNEHEFDSYTNVVPNMEIIGESVNEFVNTYLYSDCTKEKVELTDGQLLFIGDNLVYRCYANVHWKQDGREHECLYDLIIDIPEQLNIT